MCIFQEEIFGPVDSVTTFVTRGTRLKWGIGGMFSLEGPEGVRFLTRSRLFTKEEYQALQESEDF